MYCAYFVLEKLYVFHFNRCEILNSEMPGFTLKSCVHLFYSTVLCSVKKAGPFVIPHVFRLMNGIKIPKSTDVVLVIVEFGINVHGLLTILWRFQYNRRAANYQVIIKTGSYLFIYLFHIRNDQYLLNTTGDLYNTAVK